MKKLNTILIGGGHQSRKEHLPALIFSDLFELIGIVEPDQIAREEIVHILDGKNIPIMERIEELDRHINKKIDMAVVSVPHDQYLPIINFCAQRGVHILKEKPFARNEDEAKQIYDIAKKSKIKIMTSFQRRFHPIYQNFKVMLKQIGEITSVEASYTLGSKKPNSGWRSDIKKAGGGVMMDMGYHMIDLIFWYIDPFKVIDKSLTINRKGDYNTDDTSFITFEVGNVKGFIFVSCIYPIKNKEIESSVKKQLNEDISIYDNGGIYKEVEAKLKEHFPRKYILTPCNGTSALYTMFFGANIQRGDEV